MNLQENLIQENWACFLRKFLDCVSPALRLRILISFVT